MKLPRDRSRCLGDFTCGVETCLERHEPGDLVLVLVGGQFEKPGRYRGQGQYRAQGNYRGSEQADQPWLPAYYHQDKYFQLKPYDEQTARAYVGNLSGSLFGPLQQPCTDCGGSRRPGTWACER